MRSEQLTSTAIGHMASVQSIIPQRQFIMLMVTGGWFPMVPMGSECLSMMESLVMDIGESSTTSIIEPCMLEKTTGGRWGQAILLIVSMKMAIGIFRRDF